MKKMNDNITKADVFDYENNILYSNGNSYKIRRSYLIRKGGNLEEITVLCNFINGSDLLVMISLMEKLGYFLDYIDVNENVNEMVFREFPPTAS